MQFATSIYDTADNTRLVLQASLQANFASNLKAKTILCQIVGGNQGVLWAT